MSQPVESAQMLTVLDHPLIGMKMTTLRDKCTPPQQFRRTLHEIAGLMSFHVFAHLRCDARDVNTPLETTTGQYLQSLDCLLVDEAQFLSVDQVWQLSVVVDQLNIPVMCYGLRTDFRGQLFPGSAVLLAVADTLREIRTICHCGRKATMVTRLTETGETVTDGAQIEIGGNDKYVSLCREHWKEMTGLHK